MLTGIGIGVPFTRRRGFYAGDLFANNEVGVWYDPSDFSTMFQDSAGTTPVTAVEQPVGRILDKSGNGYHATQATSTARPVLLARYNLLTYSEQFDKAIWTKAGVTVSANASSDPIGGATADSIVESTATSAHYVLYPSASFSISGVRYSISIYAKPLANARVLQIYPKFSVGGNSGAKFDLVNGTATAVAGTGSGSATIVADVGGYYKCTLSFTAVASAACDIFYGLAADTAAALNVSYTGDGVSGVDVWGAQLNYGSTAAPYQRIAAATDYDTAGFLQAGDFDGVDDYLTQSAGGGSTTGLFLCAGIKPEGGAGTLRTIWSDTGTNTGLSVRLNTSNQLELIAGDGVAYTTAATTDTTSVGTAAVLTVWDDGTNLNAQINNGTVASVARPVVSAGSSTATIGKSNTVASNFYNGLIYSLVQVKNDAGTDAERASAKAYVASKAGVTL